jgi:hypothetical protein
MAEPESAALATRDAVSGLSAFAWIEATTDGLVAFLLVAPAVPEVSGADMAALAEATGLAAPAALLPDVGPRIMVDGTRATLCLPELGRALRIVVNDEWTRFVNRGGAVVLLAGADQLLPSSERSELETYMRVRLSPDGQLWLGKTRRFHSAAQLAGEACIYCGAAQPPLHPAGTLTIPDPSQDIVRVYDIALCTEHLVVER